MIEALITAVLVVSIFQKSEHLRFPGLVLGLVATTNYAICDMFSLEGFSYCFAASVCDALVICIVVFFAKVTKVSDIIIAVSCVSIMFNFSGWLLYAYELPVEVYNYSIAALYLIAILSLMGKDCANDYSGNRKRYNGLRLFISKRCAFLGLLPKEAKL